MYSKLCIVIGTRAQLIKTAPVMQELQKRKIPYYFLHTGQHSDTFAETLADFKIKAPDKVLLQGNQEAKTMFKLANWGVVAFGKLFQAQKILPFKDGMIMVHGDTPSAIWGATLGKLTRQRVFHLESGLRSYNIFQPFPEELIRMILPHFVDIHTPPGDWAMNNIRNLNGTKINTIHNTAVDALRYISSNYPADKLPQEAFVIASFHRVENLYHRGRLQSIINTVERIAENFLVIFPMHPVTKKQLAKNGHLQTLQNNPQIQLYDRLPYAQFVPLLNSCEFIITDSGSMQEELVWLGIPTLVFRDATERQEGLGRNVVLSHYRSESIDKFLQNPQQYRFPAFFPEVSPSAILVDWLEANL
jgi:UDP-N-acetylglucosamine 2-epimerase (non-hydrolysing)